MKNQLSKIANALVLSQASQRAIKPLGNGLLAPLAALLLLCSWHQAAAQGTAFTYQGQLQEAGVPANGSYDLRFALYDMASGGTLVAGYNTNSATPVSNGLFSVLLDFGTGVFNGTTYWLDIGARTNGTGAFAALSPRQELTPTPYAIFAESVSAAGLTGTLPSGSLGGAYSGVVSFTNPGDTFAGNGSGLSNVNAVTLNGLAPSSFWNITGNAGTSPAANFLGTTDNEPLILKANNDTALELQYWSSGNIVISSFNYGINVVGGYWGNAISNSASGATIAGGGYLNRFGILPPVTTSYPNVVTGDFGTIGGGWGNTAGPSSTVPGGTANIAGGTGSFAAGQYAQTSRDGSFIWGDGSKNPFTGPSADNAFSVLASGGVYFYNGTNGVIIDHLDKNDGALDYGLHFGVNSGEGIASKRTSGGNQYGLDFYTASNDRMSIDVNGRVGINTTSPAAKLEVNGNMVLVDGASGQDAYLGNDGSGNDVQVGSINSNIVNVAFWNHASGAYMHINCSTITIHGGADLAEPFRMSGETKEIPRGAVVVIDEERPGQLKLSERPYDDRVAGVVSGANGINPGIQLQQEGALDGGKNVALTGRVYVQADASNGPINPGDLLTTSTIPGHAMKVTDHGKAQGAVLGKAMGSLSQGEGLVLVLVTLQ
jgi:hypothetical protein